MFRRTIERSMSVGGLVAFLAIIVLSLIGCSTTQQCDNVADLSAQAARWICNTLSSAKAEAEAPNLSDQGKKDLLRRVDIIEDFVESQASASTVMATKLKGIGDLINAQVHTERAAILQQMQVDVQTIRDKLSHQ